MLDWTLNWKKKTKQTQRAISTQYYCIEVKFCECDNGIVFNICF